MDLILADKVAVVTGASKGIGLAVTKGRAQEGTHVVAGALTTDSLVDLDRVTPAGVDLSDPVGPSELVHRAIQDSSTSPVAASR